MKIEKKKLKEPKIALKDGVKPLKTEIKNLQTEIKTVHIRNELKGMATKVKTAGEKVSNGFWKAIKNPTNENQSQQKNADYPKLVNKESIAATYPEMCEILNKL